jgi:hypothetical protein
MRISTMAGRPPPNPATRNRSPGSLGRRRRTFSAHTFFGALRHVELDGSFLEKRISRRSLLTAAEGGAAQISSRYVDCL